MMDAHFEHANLPPEWVNIKAGKLLIAGSGHTLWPDLEQLGMRNRPADAPLPWDVMCVNDCVSHFPQKVDYAYSNDHKKLSHWVNARRPRYEKDWPKAISMHTNLVGSSRMVVWPWQGAGTSSYSAVWTGMAMGYDEIIIVGVPLDNGPHYFGPPWEVTNFEQQTPADRDEEIRHWRNLKHYNVKALSGRLTTLLGG